MPALLSAMPVRAQENQVGLPLLGIEAATAIKTIDQRAGYLFSYRGRTLDAGSWITFIIQYLTTQEVVKQIPAGKNLKYGIRTIIHPAISLTKPVSIVEDIHLSTLPNSIDVASLRQVREITRNDRGLRH